MKNYIKIVVSLGFAFLAGHCMAQNQVNKNEELGNVKWNRNYDEAISLAKKTNKDVLILFQEVPGCSTCRNYGHNVLSHPLMVEAIENLFVPLAIYNNKGGDDLKILKKYNEPTWNNPVVRIVNSNGENVVNRISNDYSASTLCRRIKESLLKDKKEVPHYLELLEQELLSEESTNVKQMNFKMYCFWTGEKQLGKLDGVVSTKSGFSNHSEIVNVTYDASKISESELTLFAKKNNFTPVASSSYKLANKDLHYYLQHSNYKYLPLTEIQKTKINSALGLNESPDLLLSPKQLSWFNSMNFEEVKNLFSVDFYEAWEYCEKEYS